jgi:hypothetical protein
MILRAFDSFTCMSVKGRKDWKSVFDISLYWDDFGCAIMEDHGWGSGQGLTMPVVRLVMLSHRSSEFRR